jgi:hypothetical protein
VVYEHKDGTGSLFANEDRRGENSPNAKGRERIGGVDYWVSAWTRLTKDGRKFQNLSFLEAGRTDYRKPVDAKEGAEGLEIDFDDKIPF